MWLFKHHHKFVYFRVQKSQSSFPGWNWTTWDYEHYRICSCGVRERWLEPLGG